MRFTRSQREAFIENGYVVVPGVVPRVMVDQSLRAINHSVGQGIDASQLDRLRATSYCNELQRKPVMTDLVNRTPVWKLAESVIGEGRIKPVGGAQIALRFPRLGDPPQQFGCHLDGMHSPNNGVPEGELRNFTMLVVVLLSDLPRPHAGNFTVWPGTHCIYERYFREHGPESLLDGMPAVDLPEPVQITGRAGDVVFTHYQVAHTAAPNHSPHIRYAAIFRLSDVDHGAHRPAAMTDIWLEWPGVREILEERAA